MPLLPLSTVPVVPTVSWWLQPRKEQSANLKLNTTEVSVFSISPKRSRWWMPMNSSNYRQNVVPKIWKLPTSWIMTVRNGDWKIIEISRNITGRMKSSAAHGCKATMSAWPVVRKEFATMLLYLIMTRTVSYWNQTTNVYKAVWVLPSKRRNWKSIWQPTIQALQPLVVLLPRTHTVVWITCSIVYGDIAPWPNRTDH